LGLGKNGCRGKIWHGWYSGTYGIKEGKNKKRWRGQSLTSKNPREREKGTGAW